MSNLCEYNQRYFNLEHDACRMCEYRDDCPIAPEDEPDPFPDCIESDTYYDNEDRDIEKRR